MWINKKDRKYYNDSKISGLRVYYSKQIRQSIKDKLERYCKWLKENFYFPIGCVVTFVGVKKFKSIIDGHLYYGVFYNCEEENKLPKIYIASEIIEEEVSQLYFFLAHELGHYFQWYFYENEKRSNRSLENLATRWANYIVSLYLKSVDGV